MTAAKKSSTSNDSEIAAALEGKPRPRLRRLSIRNFRAIGADAVTIDLDDIVVLVGPNNSGKSSILRAYEVVMQQGSNEGKLRLEDFPNDVVDQAALPEIELTTVVHEETLPGSRWVAKNEVTGEMLVREKWTYPGPSMEPRKVGWEVATNGWHESEGPWGLPGVAQIARPEPHRVHAFDSPDEQAAQIVKLLRKLLEDRLKQLAAVDTDETASPTGETYRSLLSKVAELQTAVVAETKTEIERIEEQVSAIVGRVFPGYGISFDSRPEEDVEKCLRLFGGDQKLRMGRADGHKSTIEHQGSGARRTLLWAALRILSEERRPKDAPYVRPHLLLIDEPELCLHPDAIREACKVLYDLPKTGSWQVMVTTHSPAFLDLSRDNTTIVRVERQIDGSVIGTTVFQPRRSQLDDDDRARLKMLNICDPYVAEFFFGGNTILVEGDTEYTAFREIVAAEPDSFPGVHVVRARGKATIVTLCKILNAFEAPYAVLHDSDRPKVHGRKTGTERTNPAWTLNERILDIVNAAPKRDRVRLLASVPNFEVAFFGSEAEDEKPYAAYVALQKDGPAKTALIQLLRALVTRHGTPPKGACEWTSIDDLSAALKAGAEFVTE